MLVGDIGVQALSTALHQEVGLAYLDISSNGLGDEVRVLNHAQVCVFLQLLIKRSLNRNFMTGITTVGTSTAIKHCVETPEGW